MIEASNKFNLNKGHALTKSLILAIKSGYQENVYFVLNSD